METVTLARHAMATRFEIVLHGENPVALRAAGEEALDEIERLEAMLSLYRPASEVARLNACAGREAVSVSPELLRLLAQAQQLSTETGGAFDLTIAPLMRCWGFMGGTGHQPTPEDLEAARANVGMNLVQLNPRDFTVRFAREGVMLDFGAIGKGYAVERAVEILREAGVGSALVHGGTSTACAVGHPPDATAWKIALERPAQDASSPALLAVVPLCDEAFSVSAVWGKSFQSGDKIYGHVMDPRTGRPVAHALLAAVVLPSATETDALSTALIVLGRVGHDQINGLRARARTLVITREFEIVARGIDCRGSEAI